jgi:hypothetical protein
VVALLAPPPTRGLAAMARPKRSAGARPTYSFEFEYLVRMLIFHTTIASVYTDFYKKYRIYGSEGMHPAFVTFSVFEFCVITIQALDRINNLIILQSRMEKK